jgi:WS/DGAT/MGAT family acyltransferase
MADSTPLSPEDLGFWYADQPRQRTTMALLMVLDQRPDWERLRAAAARAVDAVPRLRQRVVDAPFDLSLPRWEDDPTFDLDFHLRRYSLAAEIEKAPALEGLFRTLGPIYERPFDRSRPLWELVELEQPSGGAAVFFRLHHAVADGVGGNTILAALTEGERAADSLPPAKQMPLGAWDEVSFPAAVARAVRNRLAEDAERRRAVAEAAWQAVRHPEGLLRAAGMVRSLVEDATYRASSPLRSFGRSRHLTGLSLPLQPLREAKGQLGGRMIDVLLTGVAGAMETWLTAHEAGEVRELLTLVPINLRPLSEQRSAEAGLGNRASAIVVRLPLGGRDPVGRFAEVQRRMEARRRHPVSEAAPKLAAALAVLPRPLYRRLAYASAEALELIVTNVPGIPQARYLAGAEILAAYPFAPVAPRSPVSVALYGYRDRIYVGLDADGTAMPDLEAFRKALLDAFSELVEAAKPSSLA